jgi:hypothetical protein
MALGEEDMFEDLAYDEAEGVADPFGDAFDAYDEYDEMDEMDEYDEYDELEAADADRGAVAQAIRSMDISDGPARFFPGGRIRFDEHGRRTDAQLLVVQWQNGEPKTVYPADAALASPLWPTR